MKSMRSIAGAAAIVGALTMVGSNSASAQPQERAVGPDQQAKLALALKHSSDGYLTAADRQFLAANPKLSLSVIDPQRTVKGEQTEFTPKGGTESRVVSPTGEQATGCFVTNRYQNAHNVANIRLYSYHTRVSWCNRLVISSGSARYEINGTPSVSNYFSNVQFCMDVGASVHYQNDYWSKSYLAQYASVRQGKISYTCGPRTYTYYPKNTVYVNANGTNSAYFSK